VVIAASAQLVAAVVEFSGVGPNPSRMQLWIGPPAGPLRREVDARFKSRAWLPLAVDVDGDRVLVVEARRRACGLAPACWLPARRPTSSHGGAICDSPSRSPATASRSSGLVRPGPR
jgi:hypothetical protein